MACKPIPDALGQILAFALKLPELINDYSAMMKWLV
jgi:hypothetical protein